MAYKELSVSDIGILTNINFDEKNSFFYFFAEQAASLHDFSVLFSRLVFS